MAASKDLPGRKERVLQLIAEKNEQWQRLTDQITALHRARDYEDDPIRKLKYSEQGSDLEQERGTVDKELIALEALLREISTFEEQGKLATQYSRNETTTWGVDRVKAPAVWELYSVRGAGVTIGLLDTGIDTSHPDLQGKVSAWAEFDSDGKKVKGSRPHDDQQHGTHAAGVLVGGNASGQWIGVSPEAKVAVAKVLHEGSGTDAQILGGLSWMVEQGVDVVLVNLGSLTLDVEPTDMYSRSILTCVTKGIPVIAPIGNEGLNTTGSPGNDWFAYSVGATDQQDRPAGFSGGRTHIIRESAYLPAESLPLVYSKPEVSAPGVAIRSSTPDENWASFNGTTMAAPHVAGVMALLLSGTSIRQNRLESERALTIQDIITASVEELGESGQDHRYGFGRVDALRAMNVAKEQGF